MDMTTVAILTSLAFAIATGVLLAGYLWFLGMSNRSGPSDGAGRAPSTPASVDRLAA